MRTVDVHGAAVFFEKLVDALRASEFENHLPMTKCFVEFADIGNVVDQFYLLVSMAAAMDLITDDEDRRILNLVAAANRPGVPRGST